MRKNGRHEGMQLVLQGMTKVVLDYNQGFVVQPGHRPVRIALGGRYRFRKHYYELIDDLKATGEEFQCAQIIDALPRSSIGCATPPANRGSASGSAPARALLPDFVCELNNGRLFVVEYKGAMLADGVDAAIKRQIGEQWAKAREGKCLFVMVTKQDDDGRDVRAQLQRALAK